MTDQTEEHPAARAARMIKSLHLENIAKMNAGHVFYQMVGDEQREVNDEIREASMHQIELCNEIIDRAPFMSPEHSATSTKLLGEVTETLKQVVDEEPVEMPEIGNYDHKSE